MPSGTQYRLKQDSKTTRAIGHRTNVIASFGSKRIACRSKFNVALGIEAQGFCVLK